MAYYTNPIWKDVYFTTTGISKEFKITSDNVDLYHGKAYAIPGTNTIKINLSRICENYLSNEFTMPDIQTITTAETRCALNIYRNFKISLYNEETDTWTEDADTYTFLMSYYREITVSDTSIPRFIINGHATPNMVVPYTTSYSVSRVTLFRATATIPSYFYNTNYCGQYSMIYSNLGGGYDAFLFEGKCTKTDTYNYSSLNKTYNNTTNEFGLNRYMNIITPEFTLNSGWLTQQQGNRFVKHLAGSNRCYLQDLLNDEFIPVVITDVNSEYKDNDTLNGPINYEIHVKASQEYRRK